MIVRHEGQFEGYQGIELFYQSWTSDETGPLSRGTLVITPGLAEHSECYHRFAQDVAPLGWDIFSWDMRGHGRSEGKRGYVASFSEFSEDLHCFVQHLKKSGKLTQPFALVGHSMGGLVTLRLLLEHGDEGAGAVVLSSPLLGVSVRVPPLKDLAAKVLFRVFPQFTMGNELRYDVLTRDQEWVKTYTADSLRHDKISPALYFGMLDSMTFVKENISKVSVPILVLAAGDDRVVSRSEIEAAFPRIGSKNKKLIIYDGSYHEIFNDLDRLRVFADMNSFLRPVLGLK